MTAPLSPDEGVRAALEAALERVAYVPGDHPVVPVKHARFVEEVRAALSTPVPVIPMGTREGLPRGTASAAEVEPVAWFYEFLGHNDQWIADVRLAKPKAPSGGAIRNVRPLSFASALPSPLPSQGEPVADLPNVRGVDPQVITLAANLTAEQKRQPEWLWRNHDTGVLSFGRWPKPADLTPYVRADLVLEALAAAKARADSLKAELDEARQAIQEDGETIAECVTRAEAAEARAHRVEEALTPFAGDTMPSLRRTEIAFDSTGLRRSMSPMEIAMLRARNILKETPHDER